MALQIIVTNAGRAALVNAQGSGTRTVTIAACGISASALTPDPTLTALPSELKRMSGSDVSGMAVGPATMHLVVRDESADAYAMRSFALYLDDGTLFAIYGQAPNIVSKVASSLMLLAIDVDFADITASSLTFGDANFLNPPATATTPGVVELASDAEALALVDQQRALTPYGLGLVVTAAKLLAKLLTVDGAGSGLDADMLDGHDSSYFTAIAARLGFTPVQQGTGVGQQANAVKLGWSANNRLRLTVDAVDLGNLLTDAWLNSGTLDMNGATMRRTGFSLWGPENDGAGSGMDADFLDGYDSSYFTAIAARLGFTPVQQGTGIGQQANPVKLGWTAAGRLRLTVDTTDVGNIATEPVLGAALLDLNGATMRRNGLTLWGPENDGAGSGMDADFLDGHDSSYFTAIAARLGYTPVQQGTGIGQQANPVKLGWTAAGRLRLTVDTTDVGNIATEPVLGAALIDLNGATMRRNGLSLWGPENDGAGSGLDADLFNGKSAGWYTDIISRLGFTPINKAGDYFGGDFGAARAGGVSMTLDNTGTVIARLAAQGDGSVVLFRNNSPLLTSDSNTINMGMPLQRQGNPVWDAANDGSGSGLDADLLDGQDGSWYANINARLGYTAFDASGSKPLVGNLDVNGYVHRGGNQVWDAGNDGAGSGLDADLLDGRHGSDFALLASFGANLSTVGHQVLPNGLIVQWGEGAHTDNSGQQVVNFDTAFPNGCFQVVLSNEAQGIPVAFHGSGNLTKTGFTAYSASTSGGAALKGTAFRYHAYGN